MNKIIINFFLILLILIAGCAPAEKIAFDKNDVTFFDESIFINLEVGESSESDVISLLGNPYIKFISGEKIAWVYDYSIHLQAIFYFRESILIEKAWTDEYKNPISPKLILKARPELSPFR